MNININNKPYADGYVIMVDDEEKCSICLDNDTYTYKSWVKLDKCSHLYHRHCIDLWLENHRTCPLCTTDVYEPVQRPLTRRQIMYGCAGIIFVLSAIGLVIWFLVVEIQKMNDKYKKT
jgi:hypothetical protein